MPSKAAGGGVSGQGESNLYEKPKHFEKGRPARLLLRRAPHPAHVLRFLGRDLGDGPDLRQDVAMLTIARTGGTAAVRSEYSDRHGADATSDQVTRTALVAVAPVAAPERSWTPSRRPVAAFVAHLIAVERREPQTRARRRAEPAEAVAAYRAVSTPGRAYHRGAVLANL
jgi:hypothetical protein